MMDNFENLEKDIDGDWLSIQEKIQEDEEKEKLKKESKSPKRLHCTYKEFYRKIHEVFYCFDSYEWSARVHEILRMVLRDNEKMPKGFEKIWDAFCDTRNHAINFIQCYYCKEKYDVLYKRTRPVVSYEQGAFRDMYTIEQDTIYCPKCNNPFGRIEKGAFIGLINH